MTGEAAVTLGAKDQGMVAGDLVNTAARVQSAAAPGACSSARRPGAPAEQAIVFEDAGRAHVEGQAEPVSLWQALRVVSGDRATRGSPCLESPFVGRDRELRLIKDLFTAASRSGRAHLVSVLGVAGIGKSRLGWEFYKYIDGLADRACGTAGAAWPTARASPTGRWRTWSGCAAGSARTRSPSRPGQARAMP